MYFFSPYTIKLKFSNIIYYVNTSAVLSITGILNLDIVEGALIFSYVHIIWPLRVSLYGG